MEGIPEFKPQKVQKMVTEFLQNQISEFADCSICGICCKDCNAERGNSEFKSFLFRKNKKYKRGNIII